MWDRLSDSDQSRTLGDLVAATEREIFSEATNSDDDSDREAHDSIVEDNARVESWSGDQVDDDEVMRELLGEIPAGEAGLHPTAEQEHLARENAELRAQVAALQPRPERPDMFADPAAFEENILAQHRGAGIPVDYGTPLPGKPDQFSDPQGYERWMLSEMDRRSGIAEHEATRVNSSFAHAQARYGEDFDRAFRDISAMDPRDKRALEAVQAIVKSPDPGSALLSVHAAIRGANEASRNYGGPPFAPMMGRQRAPGEGRAMQARGYSRDTEPVYANREQAEEDDVFNATWDD